MPSRLDAALPIRSSYRLPFASRDDRIVRRWALLFAFALTAYSAAFIWRSSVVVEGRRYFCLFDDAMISMRYAANWAHGEGLVWNAGERVEGYTNFLWTLVMGLAHLLPLSPSDQCLLMQVIGIAVLWAALFATARLARECRLLPFTAVIAVALAATQYNLIFFSLMGMETAPLYVVVTLGLASAAKAIRDRRGGWTTLLWFVPAVLLRMDALLVAAIAAALVFRFARSGRARITAGFLLVVGALIAHAIIRHAYYGQWLPNTYYLKMTGWPLSRRLGPGLTHTLWTAATLGLPLLAGSIALLAPKRWHLLVILAVLAPTAYQLYVGGDGRPMSRFVVPASGGLMVLAAQGFHTFIMMFRRIKTKPAGAALRICLVASCVLGSNAIHIDHFLLLSPPQTHKAVSMNLRLLKAIERAADPDATAAVAWAGALPYYSPRRCIDVYGRCEAHIAHIPAVPGQDRAGHNKYDYQYVLSTYQPDLVLHVCPSDEPLFVKNYHARSVTIDSIEMAFFVRNDSAKVHGGKRIDTAFASQLVGKRYD